MKRPRSSVPALTRLVSVGMLLLWFAAVAHCTAICCSDGGDSTLAPSHPAATANSAPSHKTNQPGHHDHGFCDSLHSVCPVFPGAALIRPDFGLTIAANLIAPTHPVIPVVSETLIRRQPPDRHWTFTPEVCLGPALHSLAPPVASLG